MSEQPLKSYIAGKWTAPLTSVQSFAAINPATEVNGFYPA